MMSPTGTSLVNSSSVFHLPSSSLSDYLFKLLGRDIEFNYVYYKLLLAFILLDLATKQLFFHSLYDWKFFLA